MRQLVNKTKNSHTTFRRLTFIFLSTASIEDPQCSTPKSRKTESYNQGHLGPPSASPGAHAQHEDFEMGSPAWQRTPASPVSRTVRIRR